MKCHDSNLKCLAEPLAKFIASLQPGAEEECMDETSLEVFGGMQKIGKGNFNLTASSLKMELSPMN